jgi:serine protease Do
MEKEVKNQKKFNFFAWLVLISLLGFLAGIAGEIFTRYYLSNLTFFRDLYFTENSDLGSKDIVINAPKKVVIEQDLRTEQVKNDIESSMVGVYRRKKTANNLVDRIFLPEDYLGQAAILTSDGWLISTDEVLTLPRESLVVYYKNKLYDLDKVVIDKTTGVAFLKIVAQNLPVIKLADASAIKAGQSVLVYNNFLDELTVTSVKNRSYKAIKSKNNLVFSSQDLSQSILLGQEFDDLNKGCALLNLQGEVVAFLYGLETGLNQAVPINYIDPIISQVLKDEKISRPYLGINYIDLSQAIGLSPEDRQGAETGALIWPDKNGLAISQDSPLTGLLNKGDIILSLEGQKIDQTHDLIDLLLEYKTGQQITLRYLRDNKESEISIVLK